MMNSFEMTRTGLHRHAIPPNSSRAASFPGTCASFRCNFRHFEQALEPVEATSVCYRGTALPDKVRLDSTSQTTAENFYMTLTVAHISPIMAVIAGLLILIMPRLLNLVVAIYLILSGLIGLGLLKWLHM
jgi:DUF3096 family protein